MAKKPIINEGAATDATIINEGAPAVRVRLTRKADGVYNGFDGVDPIVNAVTAAKGETVEVSEEKALQLMTDFPEDWEEAK